MKLFSDAAKIALERGQTIVSGAVDIALPGGVHFRAWGGHGPLTIDGHLYVGLGDRALAQASGGALGDAAQGVTLTLSAVEPEVAAAVDLPALRNAPCVVWRLIFDGTGTQLLYARVFARGRIDSAEVEETPGGEATITLKVESAAKSLGRAGGRMRTDADHQTVKPGDVAFRKVSFAGDQLLPWGGKPPARAGQVANGGVIAAGGGRSIDVQILNRE